MNIITLKYHAIGITRSGNLEIEDLHCFPVRSKGNVVMPDSPLKIMIPAEDVPKLRQFLNSAAPES